MIARLAPLRVDDAEALAHLQNALWRSTYRGLVPDTVLEGRGDAHNTRRWLERAIDHERLGRSAEGAVTIVAHDETDAPIGWASTGKPRDDEPPTDLELWSLYVATRHHGRGVAVQLLEAVLPSPAAGHLWVLDGNVRAIAFYRKAGFVPDGARCHDPGLEADEIRMVRFPPATHAGRGKGGA